MFSLWAMWQEAVAVERASRERIGPPFYVLPWARWWNRRCTSRKPDGEYWGSRCELRPHGSGLRHAIERGTATPRWEDW